MRRLLPRYQRPPEPDLEHDDPLDNHLDALRQRRRKAKADVERGHLPDADPADLRGIPAIGRGVTGTITGEGETSVLMSQRPGVT